MSMLCYNDAFGIMTAAALDRVLDCAFDLHCDALKDKPVYIACSGGRDSLVLVWAVYRFLQTKPWFVPTVIHINHQLQPSADAWQALVESFAKSCGFDCLSLKVAPQSSSEQDAREARYRGFFSLADGGILMLAHHADDQAETLLMRLINGTARHGFLGIMPWRKMDGAGFGVGGQLILFRPLLEVSRFAITQYAKQHKLGFVDDPTNQSFDNVRGFLRQTVMPLLHTLNPKAASNIARSARHLADTVAVFDGFVAQQLSKHQSTPIAGLTCFCLVGLSADAFGKALLHAFVKGHAPYAPSSAMNERVWALAWRSDGDHCSELWWEKWVVCRYQAHLYRFDEALWQALSLQSSACFDACGVKISLGEFVCQLKLARHIGLGSQTDKPTASGTAYDQKISRWTDHIFVKSVLMPQYCPVYAGIWFLQKLSPSDKLSLPHKTLGDKKLYQSLKVPRWQRPHLYVLYCQGSLVCVFGVGQVFWQAQGWTACFALCGKMG